MASKLRFIYGCMGSTKSLRLLTTAYDFEEKNIPFIVLKPTVDTRDGVGVIKSRIGIERECTAVGSDIDLYALIKECNSYLMATLDKLEWVLVDECQFLTEKQIDELARVVDRFDINVTCFGLRTDFTGKLFPATKRLFEIADEFEEVKSRCSCGRKTSFNARIDKEGNIQKNGSQVLVGGDDIYKPLCRKCFFEKFYKQT